MKQVFLTSFNAEKVSYGLDQTKSFLATQGLPVCIAEGFSNYVFQLGDDIILRVAKTSAATTLQAKETRILPLLKNKFSFEIPHPKWYFEPSQYFPFGAIAYQIIHGRPFETSLVDQVNIKGVAKSVASCMFEFHNLPTSVIPSSISAIEDSPKKLWERINIPLQNYLSETSYALAKTWWCSFLERSANYDFQKKVIHADLWGENLILDEHLNQLVGVIDFEMLTKGDIAQDFVPQSYISKDFSDMVIENYRHIGGYLGANFEERVYDWSILRELSGLRYAISYPEANELEDSLQKVKRFWKQ